LAHLAAYGEGTAHATVLGIDGGSRLLVVEVILQGQQAVSTYRYTAEPDLAKVARWLEYLEERASRIVLHRRLHGLRGSPVHQPVQVLH
jgi:hypothetical protein